ncbi:MFS transporter [Rhodobacteraceae bacterium 2CG4]|uniref:MFS transporter n=1 Tax=Halovulum marinum TaxID=2662447 RepID=A0A6L5Z1F6_9RHOB|nr:MFS transporter [Halovulum marinum]MSU89824.1 MFS transporter [Halovulum marinum]
MRADVSPEPSYRWTIVLSAAVMLAVAMGLMVNGLSVLIIPLQEAFARSRAEVALINTAGLVGLAAGGILMGRMAEVTSTRAVCLFGAAVFSACVLAASQAQALWQLQLLFFLAGFLGAGALFAPLIANVGNWFGRGAGLALGIASAGQALGQGGVPFVTGLLIGGYGWRAALAILGAASLLLLLPLAALQRPPPRPDAAGAGGPAAGTGSPVPVSPRLVTAMLSAASFFCCTCMAVALVHLVPLIQGRGFGVEQASGIAFGMLLVGILGRIAFGRLADLIGPVPAWMLASAWQTLLVFGFTLVQGLGGFAVFAVIYGFGYAGVMTGVLATTRALAPPARRASVLGIVMVFAWAGHGLGGYQGGWFYDLTGAYTWSYANAAIAGVANLAVLSLLMWLMSGRGRGREREQAEGAPRAPAAAV